MFFLKGKVMKGLKCFVIIILLLCFNIRVNAKTKVIARNYRNVPEWVSISHDNYVVASGKGLTLAEAKSNAQISLKNLMIRIAVNKMQNQNTYFKQLDIENESAGELFKESDFYSNFDSKELDDFYWEKLKNVENKTKTYKYYLQYHLNYEEFDNVIDNIALEHQISTSLESAKRGLPICNKVQDLHEINSTLMNINSKFLDNDSRKEECENLLSTIQENYNKIEIKEMLNVPGKLIICETINDRAIYNSQPPRVKSKGTKITKIESLEEQWIIWYEFNPYLKSNSNVISVEFDNIENKRSKDFTIDINKEKVEVKLSGAPIIIAKKKMIKLYIVSSYRGDVILEKVVLNYNDINYTDTRLNQLLDGAGLYTIRYMLPPDFFKIETGDKVSGELHFISRKTGQKETYKFYNQSLSVQ